MSTCMYQISHTVTRIAKASWDYYLNKQIHLTAEHITGIHNTTADWQSRNNFLASNNYKLHPSIFRALREKIWNHSIEPVCRSSQQTGFRVCELAPRRSCFGSGRSTTELEKNVGGPLNFQLFKNLLKLLTGENYPKVLDNKLHPAA